MKLRKRQVALLVVSTLTLGLGIGATVYHQRAKRALADYQNQLIASGEKLTVSELIPKPVPSDKNGVALLLRAISQLNATKSVLDKNPPAGMTMVAPGKARVGWAQPNIRSPKATNSWEEVMIELDTATNSFTLLEELIERPTLDFNLDYRVGFALPLPHLNQTRKAAQWLSYVAIADLHRGDAASATRRLRALLALVQGSADERLFVSEMVRISLANIAVADSWEFLQSPGVTDQQLAQIQADWSRLEFLFAAENALALECAIGQMTIEQMRSSSSEFRKVASGYAGPGILAGGTGSWVLDVEKLGKDTWSGARLMAKETAWRFSWSYTDQLRALKGIQVLIATARLAQTNENFGTALETQEQRLKALGIDSPEFEDSFGSMAADVDVRTILLQGVLRLTRFLDKVIKIEVYRQLTVTAIALQRYKLRHGNYPKDLAALVPEFVPAVPRDPVDGKSLRYKPKPDGTFLLCSIGEGGEDNGGDPKPAEDRSKSLQWQRGRDWVWPQPATPQEIEDFYKDQLK